MKYRWITYKNYRLRAPQDFDSSKIVGGCGPGEWGNEFIPDSILGVAISPACDIHDYCYYLTGGTEEERTNADIELFANAFRILKQRSRKIPLFFRCVVLGLYFMACVYGGGVTYGDGDDETHRA